MLTLRTVGFLSFFFLCVCSPIPSLFGAPPPADEGQAKQAGAGFQNSIPASSSSEKVAGYIFGVGVSAGNYFFAKRVSYLFPRPWEENASSEDRERFVWEALILHYESFRRNISVSDEELEKRINSVLRGQQLEFTRSGQPESYTRWIKEKLGEDVELFENQMRYLFQIDKLKEQVRQSFVVAATEQEMQEEFLDEQHHVGGEMVVFDAKEQAEAFYSRFKDPSAWETMRSKGEYVVRPVSLMTLEAYMDLWGIPKGQIYAFHAMAIGSIGEPMPFGKQWCVCRLLDKRTGDLKNDFPTQRSSYEEQIKTKKQYEALKRWIEELVASANLETLVLPVGSPSEWPVIRPSE